jgi:polar amino acid transport system substrate-binding protein
MMAALARIRPFLPSLLLLALLAGVTLLPPDTSLAEVEAAGVLTVCAPPLYPPLVTDDSDRPGVDVELLRAVTKIMGLRLAISNVAAMGGDFNPRNWHVTRAECEALAGGIIASPTTRSFLETSPSYAETGWAMVTPSKVDTIEGSRVGVLVGASGLDRLALSAWLRAHKAQVTITPDASAWMAKLRDGSFQVGVTERLQAAALTGTESWSIDWVGDLPHYPVALGLWKGDLTLKRAMTAAMTRLASDGDLGRILARYSLAPFFDERTQ